MKTTPEIATGDHVQVIAGVYKGRSGIVCSVGKYWHEVKPDQPGVGGLNPCGCMVIGAESEWVKTSNDPSSATSAMQDVPLQTDDQGASSLERMVRATSNQNKT